MKALTKDSKNLNDFKEIPPPKSFNDIAKKGEHTEFLCNYHMKDRLLNYCHQDNLVDVFFSGLKSLKFTRLDCLDYDKRCKVKSCSFPAECRLDRID